jgi:hypothetical protein
MNAPIEISKRKDARGRIVGYMAQIGDLFADGNTPAEAKAHLWPDVVRACTYHDAKWLQIGEARHDIVIMSANGVTWGYRIKWDGDTWGCVCSGYPSQRAAERAARDHLAQQAPTLEEALRICDPETAGEIRRYFAWQECYRDARRNGANDVEAHRIACETV